MKTIIIGLGKSGAASMKALIEAGFDVSVQDSKKRAEMDEKIIRYIDENGIKAYFGEMPESFDAFDIMILSPGVDPETEFVKQAAREGLEIVGELEMAFRLAKGTFIGITGTNGKTTTTTLVGEIFKKAGKKTNVVGNIGLPVITASTASTADDYMIVEVSSFQLQTTGFFKPHVSAILNLTPDHLNRHHTMNEYGRTKARIWENQDEDDFLVINAEDELVKSLCIDGIEPRPKAKTVPFSSKHELEYGAFLRGNTMLFRDFDGSETAFLSRDELKIIGDHNIENALAAIAISYVSGINASAISQTLREFKGVEHRLEFVREINGVKYCNDSKGTNIDATVIALRAIKNDIILIAGGDAKSQEFDELVQEMKGKVKYLILFGRDAYIIREACDKLDFNKYIILSSLEECVKKASELAVPGDSVLLSPACASWDMYPNFEVRGDEFKNLVNKL